MAQLNPTMGDLAGNRASAVAAHREGRAAGADLVALPEMFLVGYQPQDLVLKPAFVAHARAELDALAREIADGPPLGIGLPLAENGRVCNVYAILDKGAVAGVARKHHLPNYNVFDEPRVFRAGKVQGPFAIGPLRVGTPICEDAWYDDVTEAMAESGAELLLVPNGSPFRRGKFDVRMNHMVNRVVETGLPLVYLNMVGGQDDQIFDGGSFVLNPGGSLAVQLPVFEEAVAHVELDPAADGWRARPGRREAHPEIREQDYRAMVVALHDYAAKSGFSKALLGLSGGVDSALVAAIAADAFGPEAVRCVMLPSEFTAPESLADAAAVARALGCRLDELSIEPGRAALKGTLAPLFAGLPEDVTEENLQSRLRGVLLMALSNKFGRVEPRNTPTMINAVFNHRNFWDMRAQNIFNGVNPFGDRDPNAFLYSAPPAQDTPQQVRVRLENSSLASQAVGPPTNRFEMSADGRPFPEVGDRLMREGRRRHRLTGRRLLTGRPLALQLVARDDSVLGPLSRAPLRGLNTTYEALIRQAFHTKWWDSVKFIQVDEESGATRVVNARDADPASEEYTLLEFNFSLFFGLAVQAYEATLVSDDTPFDRFLKDPVRNPLSAAAERGRKIFFNENPNIPGAGQPIPNPPPGPRGGCAFCHSGALLSEASVEAIQAGGMVRTSSGQTSDRGTRNIGVRETNEDLGNAGVDPFGASLSAAVLAGQGPFAADGTFKIPSLRNVELTAPYFHTGGEATLEDVVDFYARGGNRGGASNPITTRDGTVIGGLGVLNFNQSTEFFDGDAARADLVAFLKALTDERVRKAAAPFDHPQIFVPNGHPGGPNAVTQRDGRAVDTFLMVPATGRNGGPILPGFLE